VAKPSKQQISSRHNGTTTESLPGTQSILVEYAALRYDYEQVSASHRQALKDAAVDINRKQRRAREDMLAVGRRLIEVKEFLPYGQFLDWLEAEFELGDRMARRQMDVSRAFADPELWTRVSKLSDGAIYALAAPSTPDAVRWEVARMIDETGKVPTRGEVERVIEQSKQLPAPAPRMIEMKAETPAVAAEEPAPNGRNYLPDSERVEIDDPELRAAGFWLIRTKYGPSDWLWQYWWHRDNATACGAQRGTLELAVRDARVALSVHQPQEPSDPTPPDLAAGGYHIELWKNTNKWVWSRATGLLDDRMYCNPYRSIDAAIEDARHDLWLRSPKLPEPILESATKNQQEPIIDADYVVIKPALPDAGKVYIPLNRELAQKLCDGVVHRIFRTFFSGEEMDQLLIALTSALREQEPPGRE
jgi:Protein of unknown function (DUF3102)